jgi:hypothetical protein
VRSFCHHLLQRLAFSESRHFSWDKDPTRTMAYCTPLEHPELCQNANTVIRIIPPIPFQHCNDSPRIYSCMANWTMQLHWGNTSACGCIAQCLRWVLPHGKISMRHTTQDAHDITFFLLPQGNGPPNNSILLVTPSVCMPVLPTFIQRRVVPMLPKRGLSEAADLGTTQTFNIVALRPISLFPFNASNKQTRMYTTSLYKV